VPCRRPRAAKLGTPRHNGQHDSFPAFFASFAVVTAALLFCPLGGISGAEDPRWAVIPESLIVHGYGVTPASSALNKALTDAAEHVLGWGLPKDAQAWRRRRTQVEIGLRKAIGLEALPERTPRRLRELASFRRRSRIDSLTIVLTAASP
jgi:hypothetical protein